MNRDYLNFLQRLIKEIFSASLVTYLILYLTESLSSGFVSNFLNMNYFLILVIISGIITVLFEKEGEEIISTKKPRLKAYIVFIILLSLTASVFIWFRTKELGWLSYLIAFVSGVVIVFISVLMLTEQEADEKK